MLEQFDFTLPKELIAQRPAQPRDHARLLVYRRADRSITDDYFYNIDNYLPIDSSLVLNRAKVDKCRLGFKDHEVFLLQTVNDTTATAMVRPGKKFKLGSTVELAQGISAEVVDINDEGHRTLIFNIPLDDARIVPYRLTPLPPYIAQDETLSDEYQTVYAKDAGSKAAPTAGLHFTHDLLQQVSQKHDIIEVTLDVGLGTFAAIDEQDITRKTLHTESYNLTDRAARQLNDAKHITAVGTTSTRLLEAAYAENQKFTALDDGSTDIFIQPQDQLKIVSSMITNFHLPKTSLLMLVAAVIGTPGQTGNVVEDNIAELMRIYAHAIEQRYRFYSFGDAMLIL
jgi:S-adenosylmethionine:tRNA ribosyltransferase-isomerase